MALDAVQTDADVDLRQYLGIVWRRKRLILLVFVLTMLVGYAYMRVTKPLFSAEARIVVESVDSGVSMVDADNPLSELLSRATPDRLSTQLESMQVGPFLAEARKRVKTELPADAPGDDVRVENLEATDIIGIRVTSGSPKYSAEMANAVADLHLEKIRKQSLRGIRDALQFAERETTRARRGLEDAERSLMLFRTTRRVEEVAVEEQQRMRESLDLQSRMRQARADFESVSAEVRDLRAQLRQQPETVVNISESDNPRVQQLRDRLADLEQRRAAALFQFKETSPQVRALDAELNILSAQLRAEPLTRETRTRVPNPMHAELQARLRQREDEERRLRGAYNRVAAELEARQRGTPASQLGAWEVRLAALTRERDQAQRLHGLFLEKVQDLRIREKANRPGARILLRATAPSSPSFPNATRMLLVAAVLGLILGIGCAFLAERLDDRVQTPEDAERLAHAGMLGHVPLVRMASPRLVSQLPAHSHFSESYRTLRSSIAFAALDAPVRSILISSVNRGDGKSLTCVNLATAIAMDGKRVILVDADLRRPTVHALLETPQEPGLTDYLCGRCPVHSVIRPTPTTNFDVICAGPIPTNPSELLNTRAMSELLETLCGNYDVVLIDSSPCTVVTDALVIATQVDGVMLVIDVGKTEKEALRYARDLLDRARARVLGLVCNRVGRNGRHFYGRYGYYSKPFEENHARRQDAGAGRDPQREEGSYSKAMSRVAVIEDEDEDPRS
jgi:capsular exopolysaccharide synthesis family protein